MTLVSRSRLLQQLLCIAVMFTTAAPAFADSPEKLATWRLEYKRGVDAPVNCPDEEYIRTALSAKLHGRDPFAKDAPRSITVELVRTPDRMEGRIQVRDEAGNVVSSSTAHAPSWRCDQLADRVVFFLRDIVDPLELPTPEAPVPAPTAPAPPTTAHSPSPAEHVELPPASKAPAPTAPRPSWRRPKLALSGSAGATTWNAPSIAFSSTLGIAARWEGFSLGVEGRYDHAWDLPLSQVERVQQAGAVVLVCGYHTFSPTRFFGEACILGDVAGMWIDVDSFRLGRGATSVANLGVRLGGGLSLFGPFSAEIRLDGLYAILSPGLSTDGREGWRMPRLYAAVRAGIIGQFDVL